MRKVHPAVKKFLKSEIIKNTEIILRAFYENQAIRICSPETDPFDPGYRKDKLEFYEEYLDPGQVEFYYQVPAGCKSIEDYLVLFESVQSIEPIFDSFTLHSVHIGFKTDPPIYLEAEDIIITNLYCSLTYLMDAWYSCFKTKEEADEVLFSKNEINSKPDDLYKLHIN